MRFVPVFAATLLLAACEASRSVQHETERAASATAATCPVSGKAAQGDVSVVHDGQTVSFCCEKCLKSFKENPEQFMANYSANGNVRDNEEEKPTRTEGSGARAPRRVEGSSAR